MKRKIIMAFCACIALSACNADDGKQLAKTELLPKGSTSTIAETQTSGNTEESEHEHAPLNITPEAPTTPQETTDTQQHEGDTHNDNIETAEVQDEISGSNFGDMQDITSGSTNQTFNEPNTPMDGSEQSEEEVADERELLLQGFMVLLDVRLSELFGNNYSTEIQDGNLIFVKIWEDGVTYDALFKTDYSSWAKLRENILSASTSLHTSLIEAGLDDMHISLNLANDINTNNVLLTTIDDAIFFDFMETK